MVHGAAKRTDRGTVERGTVDQAELQLDLRTPDEQTIDLDLVGSESGTHHEPARVESAPVELPDPRARGPYERFVKPGLDIVVGTLLTIITLPAVLAITVAIWISMGRPAVFTQKRVGRGGRSFTVFKFRTMAHDRRALETPFVGQDRRFVHKSPEDPRITRVGRFLRKWSLDEIPQFWNVVLGQMSLVGPRPELVEIVETKYEPWQHRRHEVKPGITGLWQVSLRNGAEMHQTTEVDLEYLRSVTFLGDLKILLWTVPAALGYRMGS